MRSSRYVVANDVFEGGVAIPIMIVRSQPVVPERDVPVRPAAVGALDEVRIPQAGT